MGEVPEVIDSFQGKYRFLSNLWPVVIQWHGIEFPTLEHAYQAAKSKRRDDWEFIAAAPTPGQAKQAGRDVALRPHWNSIKLDVVWLLLQKKFPENSELARMLIKTYPAELIEGNHWGDTFWGVCRGEGSNHLGRLLMQWRAELMGLVDR